MLNRTSVTKQDRKQLYHPNWRSICLWLIMLPLATASCEEALERTVKCEELTKNTDNMKDRDLALQEYNTDWCKERGDKCEAQTKGAVEGCRATVRYSYHDSELQITYHEDDILVYDPRLRRWSKSEDGPAWQTKETKKPAAPKKKKSTWEKAKEKVGID